MLYAGTVRELVNDWSTDESASYGFVVLAIALWFAWSRRTLLLTQPASPDGRGIILIGVSCAVLTLGTMAGEFFLKRLAFVMAPAALIWTVWGLSRLRVLAFPFVMLTTAIPLPSVVYNRMTVPLQLIASEAAAGFIQLTGGTVYRDGNILHVPGLTVGVAEACSGLRSLSAVIVVALLMGVTHCTRTGTRVVLLALVLPLVIAVNIARVTGTVLLVQVSEEIALGFYHSVSGWAVFILTSICVYLMAKGLHAVLET